MPIENYQWSAVRDFVGRDAELAALEAWWTTPSRGRGINLFGRRRVGKTWLFRRFAHRKPAVILVAIQSTLAQQLSHLADQLAPHLGVRPQLRSIDELFELIFQMGSSQKILVVLDELPYLLGTKKPTIKSNLSVIQAAIERHRASSQTRLMICGSAVAEMESLQSELSPLRGRFQPLDVGPLPFHEARGFFPRGDVIDHFIRYSIAGGMPTYLETLALGTIEEAVVRGVVSRHAPLFNEVEAIVASELNSPNTYMGILGALAAKPAMMQDIRRATGLAANELSPYLEKLQGMRLIRPRKPVGAKESDRSTQFECSDHFLRFWFRFVQPYQTDLESGADPAKHFSLSVKPVLAQHTSVVFEEQVRRWMRMNYPHASRVGSWWGKGVPEFVQSGERSTEEIDGVGLHNRNVVVVCEAKWEETKRTATAVLTDVTNYKLPAMQSAKLKISPQYRIAICSRAGFTKGLFDEASRRGKVDLVTAHEVFAGSSDDS